jgi:glycine/serine hydroxymethyltransferase
MKETEMEILGRWIVAILRDPENTELQAQVRAEVKALAVQFPVP